MTHPFDLALAELLAYACPDCLGGVRLIEGAGGRHVGEVAHDSTCPLLRDDPAVVYEWPDDGGVSP